LCVRAGAAPFHDPARAHRRSAVRPTQSLWRPRWRRVPPAHAASATDGGDGCAAAHSSGRRRDIVPTSATTPDAQSRGAHSRPTGEFQLRAAPSLSLATPDHELRLALTASWRLILGVTYVLVLHTDL